MIIHSFMRIGTCTMDLAQMDAVAYTLQMLENYARSMM